MRGLWLALLLWALACFTVAVVAVLYGQWLLGGGIEDAVHNLVRS